MDKQRFVLAIALSAAILFGWSLLFPVKPPPPTSNANANANISATPQNAGQTAASPQTSPQAAQPAEATPVASTPDTTPQRIVSISTPLYDVKLDSHGAVATSWIIKKKKNLDDRKDAEHKLYSVASTRNNPQPLQLISPEGLNRGEAPLRLETEDPALNTLLNTRNYSITGEGGEGELAINLEAGQSRDVEFVLRDEATGLDARKTLTFYADQYSADIKVNLKRGDRQLSPARLLIGPSIGDQGISQYTFYSVAPEGVANVGDKVARHYARAINENKESPDREVVSGPVDWVGIGDTYFVMVAVPPAKTNGTLEYRTTKYEHPIAGNAQGAKEARYLITGLMPIPTDGSPTHLYVGPKDHYLLDDASGYVSKAVGRAVDLEGIIDYGFLATLSRPLAMPILWSIKHLSALTGSYGVAIILFTIVIYSLFFPLKWRSSKAMKKAQKLAPRMKELQEKIKAMKKTDPRLKDLQMEQMRLMKEGNPLGGCLPLLIQMPFLFALYRAITISIDFRQASFLWIPDLSAAEPTAIHILPLLMAGSMMVLQLITPAPSADPLQRKMMAIGMPLLMLWMLWSAPAGLLVYWLVGNIVGFSQQFLINRLTKTEDDEQPPAGKKDEARPTKKLNTPRVSQA
ncbi:MAG TPA: membrane protein insertase YidC [Pyrinomonadaceae bacterium]|jgi:YidC/Oxa1 family membrane protein insertase